MRKINTAQKIILVIGLIALAIRCFTYEPAFKSGGRYGLSKGFNETIAFHCLGIIAVTSVLMLLAGVFGGRLEPVPLLHKVETCIYSRDDYSRDGAEMLYIPAGEFIMGTSDDQIKKLLRQFPNWKREWFADEQPQRRVIVDDFYIDRYPVTNAQFEQFVKATGYKAEGSRQYWREYYTEGKGSHPVVMVSWNDASAYCQWAGKRLPTEAEWEKAARANDGRIWPWGNAWDNSKCNSRDGGPGTTTPVGSYPTGASPYGVQTGMMKTTTPLLLIGIRKAHHRGNCVCCAAVRGATIHSMCAPPTATDILLSPCMPTSVFVVRLRVFKRPKN